MNQYNWFTHKHTHAHTHSHTSYFTNNQLLHVTLARTQLLWQVWTPQVGGRERDRVNGIKVKLLWHSPTAPQSCLSLLSPRLHYSETLQEILGPSECLRVSALQGPVFARLEAQNRAVLLGGNTAYRRVLRATGSEHNGTQGRRALSVERWSKVVWIKTRVSSRSSEVQQKVRRWKERIINVSKFSIVYTPVAGLQTTTKWSHFATKM